MPAEFGPTPGAHERADADDPLARAERRRHRLSPDVGTALRRRRDVVGPRLPAIGRAGRITAPSRPAPRRMTARTAVPWSGPASISFHEANRSEGRRGGGGAGEVERPGSPGRVRPPPRLLGRRRVRLPEHRRDGRRAGRIRPETSGISSRAADANGRAGGQVAWKDDDRRSREDVPLSVEPFLRSEFPEPSNRMEIRPHPGSGGKRSRCRGRCRWVGSGDRRRPAPPIAERARRDDAPCLDGEDTIARQASPAVIGHVRMWARRPDERTGMATRGLWGTSGVGHEPAEATTPSPGSQNSSDGPSTRMWSAPAGRRSFDRTTWIRPGIGWREGAARPLRCAWMGGSACRDGAGTPASHPRTAQSKRGRHAASNGGTADVLDPGPREGARLDEVARRSGRRVRRAGPEGLGGPGRRTRAGVLRSQRTGSEGAAGPPTT